MSQSSKPLTLAISAAIAAGSLFSMQAMAHGYLQDAGKAAASEGKCGEGKCGAGMMTGNDKAAHEGSCGMAKMDADKDGRLSRTEFAAAHGGKDDKFATIDTDSDGFISQKEMDAHHAGMKKPAADGKAATEGKCGGSAMTSPDGTPTSRHETAKNSVGNVR